MNFKYTSAIKKIRALTKKKKVIQGGSSAGKTIAILGVLIDKCARYKNISVSIVSENMPHLKRGAMRDFLKIMKNTYRYIDKNWNRSHSIYTFNNGSYIEFFGADNDSKLRGARRDILYLNECNNVSFESYSQLAIRTNKEIYLDYNPVKRFWVHQELLDQDDVDFLKLNYKDNEGLDQSIIDELEKAVLKAKTSDYWRNWVNVYVKGELGSLEGVIYTNWKRTYIIPEEAEFLGLGLDFGFSNDPTAIIAAYRYDGKILLEEICYKAGMLNSDIAKTIKQFEDVYGWSNGYKVICDSSEPKSIAELRKYGINAIGVKKGKDSVIYGISLVQEYDMLVLNTSSNLINELETYSWLKKSGKTINIPEDKNNHLLDAMRYLIMNKFSKKRAIAKPFRL